MTRRPAGDEHLMNADAPWDDFDPLTYVQHNYRLLQREDAEILCLVRDHFADHFGTRSAGSVSGIDVGAGANLYPAFAMLPWCEEITLQEHSPANVAYLRFQADGADDHWDPFWQVLCENEAYASVDPWRGERFRRVVRVEQGSVFGLSERPARWSMGTMFFVAESMTTSHQEFFRGVECFLRALTPGAPFAAGFMEHSLGYHVGEHFYPACDVGEHEVRASLEPFTADLKVQRLRGAAGVRDGYSGLIVAYGTRRS